MRAFLFALLAATGLMLPGCATGLIYSHTTVPLDVNFTDTPIVDRTDLDDTRHFRFYVQVDWNKNAIGDIAKRAGFQEVYYADFEELSVLGIWTQRYVHVYGK